ncbi:MAG: carbohydrate ABC transporter permease [Anaerolineae bacterium]
MPSSSKFQFKPKQVLIYGILILWCLLVYFPLYWTLITSFKLPVAIGIDVTYIPWVDFQPSLHAWRDVFYQSGVMRSFINGMVVSLTSAAIAVLLGAMAGFGLTRFNYKFGFWRNNDIAFWFVSQRIMPPIVVVLAFLIMFRVLGLIDTQVGLILAYLGFNLTLAVWMLRDFFANIPRELEESALIDGASWFRAFWSITLPLAVPGLVATFILCFIFTWNEFLFALILTFQKAGTVPLLLASQVTNTGVQWWRMGALSIMSIVPSIACALILERYIVKGLFSGGIK